MKYGILALISYLASSLVLVMACKYLGFYLNGFGVFLLPVITSLVVTGFAVNNKDK